MFAKAKTNKIVESKTDRIFQGFTSVFLIFVLILVGYPVIYVLSCSFSSDVALKTGRVVLLPVEPTLAGYEFVFQFKRIWIGYRNTIFYTISGVLIQMTGVIITAYPLARPKFKGRKFWMKYFFVTTLISGGMIPLYMVRSWLGMVNTIWAVIFTGVVSVSHVLILRTAISSSIPGELFEAAEIDGASEIQMLTQIAMPLVKSTLSVLVLYKAVGCWNDYFNAMLYLRDTNLYPLQLFLRPILTAAQSISMDGVSADMADQVAQGTEQIQYALIVISTVPVLLFYFATQKNFKKGVMIGSVKG